MKLKDNIKIHNTRGLKLLCSVPLCWLLWRVIEAALLRSKDPIWFSLYSSKKLLLILILGATCGFLFYVLARYQPSEQILEKWGKIACKYWKFFFLMSFLCSIPFLFKGVAIGEDIASQVSSSLRWNNGENCYPNFTIKPLHTDLSKDKSSWSIRPVGATLLPIPGLLLGLSLGNAIKLGIFFCMLLGSFAWIKIFEQYKIHPSYMLTVAIILGSLTGSSINNYSSANIILFLLTPNFILFSRKIIDLCKKESTDIKVNLLIISFLLLLGFFSWVKLSGMIVAGTILAYFFFSTLNIRNRYKTPNSIFNFVIYGLVFWMPYLLLELVNYKLTGISANDLYSSNDSEMQAPLYGKFWGESTKGLWLLWSFVSAPGYSLPAKEFAHGVRDLAMQFPYLIDYLHSLSINEHVLFSGSIGILLSFILFKTYLKGCIDKKKPSVLFLTFFIIPFIGLACLSNKFEWNYLLFYAHTFEYSMIFLLPILITLSWKKEIHFSAKLLSLICLSFPIAKNTDKFFRSALESGSNFMSKTEAERGLGANRFSTAIEFAEKDSNNSLDILYFLPVGDKADLNLRTKMRTLSTHFSAGNFSKIPSFYTSQPLNVYCAYDNILSLDNKFLISLNNNFPQISNREIILSDEIILEKLMLHSINL